MDGDLLLSLKALSDASRLRILGLLASGPMAGEEIARELKLGEPTIAHHLKRLRAAGLVEAQQARPYVLWTLRKERLAEIGRALDGMDDLRPARSPMPGGLGSAEDGPVLRAFVVDDRLVTIPAQERKRRVVLRWLLERCFADDRDYPEKEVNMRLALHHPDVAALRRDLVDLGYLTRSAGVYRRKAAPHGTDRA